MQSIFKRYEQKHLVTREQAAALAGAFSRRMAPDRYGEYLVQNLYYDTAGWDVVRASIEKPVYKEKLRLRCYGVPNRESKAFLELKKKYRGVVYKRRIAFPAQALGGGTVRAIVSRDSSQIGRELDFYMRANPVSERMYISYLRTALAGEAGGPEAGLRVTFDTDVRFRLDLLDYAHPGDGWGALPSDRALMEIKTLGGMPMWMARALCENGAFPAGFSKYGACYAAIAGLRRGLGHPACSDYADYTDKHLNFPLTRVSNTRFLCPTANCGRNPNRTRVYPAYADYSGYAGVPDYMGHPDCSGRAANDAGAGRGDRAYA
ncbi:MAG: polyphosphate polymerase domain-containing protein [Clostridiales bacterium]|jgi:hypothetical protein|nr:polyphosphate polymerase domain-containing protein [Clostridiales bacterium]